jgi:hypothetical protein
MTQDGHTKLPLQGYHVHMANRTESLVHAFISCTFAALPHRVLALKVDVRLLGSALLSKRTGRSEVVFREHYQIKLIYSAGRELEGTPAAFASRIVMCSGFRERD